MRNLPLIILFLAILQLGHSQSFVVGNEPLEQKKFLDDDQVFIYQDAEGELTFEAIAHPNFQNNFKPRSQFKDYASTGNLWLRFTINNNTDQRKDLVFYANDWDVQFFTLDKTNFPIFAQPQGVLVKTYNDHLYSGEDADCKIADDIMPHSSKTYYVKTKGILKELAFKDYNFIAVSDRQSADSRALFDLWSIGIYAGVLLLILFGDFYLMVTAYKRSYLLYALYSSCHLFFFTGYYQIPALFSFQWPFSHSLFLPITAILYLAFIHSYLSLSTVNKLISRFFKIYIFLGSLVILVLFYLNLTDMVAYYKLLPLANKVNLFSILVGTLLLIKIPGKLKYFVFLGSIFIILGATLTWITQYHNAYAQTFFYSFAGNALEKITFLFGIFYLHNREQNASRIKLMNAQKQLELSQQQLTNFSNSIKEKNRLIETFEAQMEQSKTNQTQKQEYIKQLTNSIILTEADWDNFKSIFEEVYPNFFFMLKQDYPQITQAEIRLIAMLKLNLNNKEIGGMLGISPESVIKTKYRLKKKLATSEQGGLASLLEEI